MVQILDPDSILEFWAGRRLGGFDSAGNAYFLLPDGTYQITTLGEYNYRPVFLTYDNLTLNANKNITFDERTSHEVVFNPAKSGQVFAEVYHGMMSEWRYLPNIGLWFRFGIFGLWYYPRDSSVYYSTSANLWSIDRYVYYPVSDVNPSNPLIISTNIWHDLLYVEKEISSSKTRVADYSQLVTKHTEYRATAAPRHSAERRIWAFRYPMEAMDTISWLMNVPYSRTEIVTPDTSFYGFYRKGADLPGFSTPYWEYYGWFWTGGMAGSETKEVWGEQPLYPPVTYVTSRDAGGGRFDISLGAVTFADSSYYYPWFHARYPLNSIDVKVFKAGVEIPIDWLSVFYWMWGDYYLELRNQQPEATYTLKTVADEYQTLSRRTILEYDFKLNNDGSISRAPVVTNIDVKDLTSNNTLEKPSVNISFQLRNWTNIYQLTFEYSTDGGATWLLAPVNVAGPNTYTASFTVYGQKYVSIRINATDTNNLKTSTTTIDGFFVKGALTLADFPRPYVDLQNRIVLSTVIVGNSDPHGPSGGAHTLDTVGGMMVAARLGYSGGSETGRFYLDTDIAWYNASNAKVYYWPLDIGNIITVGGPGVNMITWRYFANPWYAPVYYQYQGGEWILVTPRSVYRSSEWVAHGRDVALVESVYVAEENRYVLVVAGFGGDGTRAATLIIQLSGTSNEVVRLNGKAMIIQWIDSNGNAKVDKEDTWNILEIVT
jgi:hypothetical protein